MPSSRSHKTEKAAAETHGASPHTASLQRTEEERQRLRARQNEREALRTQRRLTKEMNSRAPSKRG